MYAKLFESLTDSTVWALPHHVRVVWVTIMAKADRTGYLAMSVYMLARASNVTLSECEEALALFMAPDPHSRTKDHEGRRLIPGPDGWQVVNYVKYRNMRSEEERREYRAEWMRNHRQQQKREQPVNRVNESVHKAEAEAEAEPKAKKEKRPKTCADVDAFWAAEKLHGQAVAFWDHFESNGWKVGGKTPMQDWKAAARGWSRRELESKGPQKRRPEPDPAAGSKYPSHEGKEGVDF